MTDRKTPLLRCDEAGHRRDRHSPDGFIVIEECDQCGLAWLFSPSIPHHPVTLHGWMQSIERSEDDK